VIDPKRLERRMTELARIGGSGTAVSRLGLSADEQRARDLVGAWLSAKGAQIRRDAAANLFARFAGDGEAVLVGSHLDSVPEGGRFDGALGVLCAVEALESLVDAKVKLRRPVEVVAWADEEGARFGVGLFGSAAAFGRLSPGVADRRDRDGVSIAEALRALGERGDPAMARRDPTEFVAYLELHIEQGPVLERDGLSVGVVTGTAGVVRHAGTFHLLAGGAVEVHVDLASSLAARRTVELLRGRGAACEIRTYREHRFERATRFLIVVGGDPRSLQALHEAGVLGPSLAPTERVPAMLWVVRHLSVPHPYRQRPERVLR